MTVGRDGNVYLISATHASGYVLRVSPDGKAKLGGDVVSNGLTTATANAAGLIATANAHFTHAVNIYDKDFNPLAACDKFLNNDKVSWYCPTDVQAGETDFYGLNLNRDGILRVAPTGGVVAAYPLKATGESFAGRICKLRVWEGGQRLYLATERGKLYVLDFDGKLCWSTGELPVGGNEVGVVPAGGFDVDEAGQLLVIKNDDDTVHIYDAGGKPTGQLKLQMPEPKGKITDLQVIKDEIFIKRDAPAELFQVYDRATGALKRSVRADAEQIEVTYPGKVWTSGQKIPFAIQTDGAQLQWHIWAAHFGDSDWRELEWKDGQLSVPGDFAGLYQIRIGPILDPTATSEYNMREIIEARIPESRGTVSVWIRSTASTGRGARLLPATSNFVAGRRNRFRRSACFFEKWAPRRALRRSGARASN